MSEESSAETIRKMKPQVDPTVATAEVQSPVPAKETQSDEPFWLSLLPDKITITKEQIKVALTEADVTEAWHIFNKPNEINGALLSLIRNALGDLRQKVKEHLRDE